MGNEAIAHAALAAGVNVVTGYPGTPSTEILETIAKYNFGSTYVEWSVNEKVALEIAAGATYVGARSMVTMKQVGLNVASDPLMSLTYIGVKGGMIIVVADDPGPLSSQTEQDTRHFAKYANLPVLDPSTPEEAYMMVGEAFALSERIGLPVFLRPTTRICHARAAIEISEERLQSEIKGFVKDPRWVIFPPLAYRRHIEIEKLQRELANLFEDSSWNFLEGSNEGNCKIGVVAGGVSYTYMKELKEKERLNIKLLKIGTPYPLPERLILEFFRGLETVLVLEELDPVIEEGLCEIAFRNRIPVNILGKKTDVVPFAGEFTYDLVKKILFRLLGFELSSEKEQKGEIPSRSPILCAGCPHRAAFYAVKQALRGKKAVFTGDIGCYTLGNAKPLEMTDTCLCMGAGITIAQGLARAKQDGIYVAFVGDSTFFHTGLSGIINAVYNKTDLTVVVLDNATTAMTGHQPHPGIGKTMMGEENEKVDIYRIIKALGIVNVERVDPFEQKKAIEVVKRITACPGVNVILFEAPCITLYKPQRICKVSAECSGCQKCVREIGCPALYLTEDKKVAIEPSLCYGCTLCVSVCPFHAIFEGSDGISLPEKK